MSANEASSGARKACCLVSEILEESGLDRARARRLRREILQGIVLLCQWQLERIPPERSEPQPSGRRARKVAVD